MSDTTPAKLEVLATLEGIAVFLEQLSSHAHVAPLSAPKQYALGLIFEECCAEILHYISSEKMEIYLWIENDEMACMIAYEGKRDNWLEEAPAIDRLSSVNTRRSKGMGVHLAKQHTSFMFLDTEDSKIKLRFSLPIN